MNAYERQHTGKTIKDIRVTLQKLHALANGTNFEHERDAALQKLQELMGKYGVTEDEINDELIATYRFKWKGCHEKRLLYQIFYNVTGLGYKERREYIYRKKGRKVANEIGLDCTLGQKIKIDFLFDFYKTLYDKEESIFYLAFIQKHHLYGKGNAEEGEYSEKELLMMSFFIDGMSNDKPQKQLIDKFI